MIKNNNNNNNTYIEVILIKKLLYIEEYNVLNLDILNCYIRCWEQTEAIFGLEASCFD